MNGKIKLINQEAKLNINQKNQQIKVIKAVRILRAYVYPKLK